MPPLHSQPSFGGSNDQERAPTIHSSQITSLNSQPVGSLNPPHIDTEKASSNSGFAKPHAYPAQQNLTTSSNFFTGSADTKSLDTQPGNSLSMPIVPEEANGNLLLTQHGYLAQQKLTTTSFVNDSARTSTSLLQTPLYKTMKCLCSSIPISNWKPSAI